LPVRGFVLLSLLLVPQAAWAQSPADSARITRIAIERNDVFDSTEAHSWLTRLANRLHVTTREGVVRRELLLGPGEPFDSARAAETERNLRALGIFRGVSVDTVRSDSGLVLQVRTHDGWSTRPDLRFKSTGGQAEYVVAFIEDNLLGTATQATIKYKNTVDRSSTDFGFLQPRFLASQIRLQLGYEDRSDGRRFSALVGKPFHALSAPSSLLLHYDDREERILRFFGGERVASDTVRRDYNLLRLDGAVALRRSNRGYTRLGFSAQMRKDRYRPQSFSGFLLPDQPTYAAGPYLEWRRAHFVVTRSFQGFGREEDVDVSSVIRVGALAAPEAFNYERDGIAPYLAARTGASLGSLGFGYLDLRANGMYSGSGLDSGSVALAGTLVLLPAERHSLVLHADGGWLENPLPGEEFDLGLGTGPRAFRSHAFTGDRTFFLTAEYRLTLVDELWQVLGIGLAGFVDYGGAWYNGDPRRTGYDAGIGLRLGASRAAGVEAIRIDLARRFANDAEGAGWVVSVGKGLPFSLSPTGNRGPQ
jgi:hypothetical protein